MRLELGSLEQTSTTRVPLINFRKGSISRHTPSQGPTVTTWGLHEKEHVSGARWKGPVQERDLNASGKGDHGKALVFKNAKPAVEYEDQVTTGRHTKSASPYECGKG